MIIKNQNNSDNNGSYVIIPTHINQINNGEWSIIIHG